VQSVTHFESAHVVAHLSQVLVTTRWQHGINRSNA